VFTDRTNRSVPVGSNAVTPDAYEWTFIVNGTSCVTASNLTSATAGPHTITYTIPTKGETFTVRLKVSNATANLVSEYSKQITLTRHVSSANPVKLTAYRHVPGDNNNYNLPEIGAVIRPSDGRVHLDFNSSRTSGNATYIELSSTTMGNAGLSNTTSYFTYSGVGISEQENDCTKTNNGNSRLSVKWGTNGNTVPSGQLRVDVRYQGNNAIKLTRFITFSNSVDANTICTSTPVANTNPPVILTASGPVFVAPTESVGLVDETIVMSRKVF